MAQKTKQVKKMDKEEAKKITKEITEFMKNNIKNFWEISKRLEEIKEREGWEHFGFKSFEEYSENLFDLARSAAYAYIQARKYMEKHHSDYSMRMENVEPQKILLLNRLDNEEFEEKRKEFDDKVFGDGMSWRDLNEEIKKLRGKDEEWLRFLDVWNFSSNTGEGISNLPPEIIKNLLYYFTEEGDLVLDPFAGSGQTKDICDEMQRECLCSDIKPLRDFILKWDLDKGLPTKDAEPTLIFLDPPYWKMVDYGEGSWGNLSLEEFYSKIDELAKNCYNALKENGKVALIIMPLVDNGEYVDLGLECCNIFKKYFEVHRRLCVPLCRNWALDKRVKESKESKKILVSSLRDLMIFEK